MPEPSTEQDSAALAEIRRALELTRDAGSARIRITAEWPVDEREIDEWLTPSTRRPGDSLLRNAMRLGLHPVRWVLRALMERFERWFEEPGIGVIDFEGGRCMWTHPNRRSGTLIAGGRRWEGWPGTPVAELTGQPAKSNHNPMWLLDLLRAVEDARASGEEVVDGETLRRFSVRANLIRAGDAVSYDIATPPGENHMSDLTRVPLAVYVDGDGYVRRVADDHESPPLGVTLDLSDFGTELPSDTSRVPSFPEPAR